jgi:hypothetical protein
MGHSVYFLTGDSRFPRPWSAKGTTTSTRKLLSEMPTSLPQFEWHRWFAWRPVFLQTRTGTRSLVWLQYVERRWNESQTNGSGPLWVYQRATSGERGDIGEAR